MMGTVKFLLAISLMVSIAAIASAGEVISVDINNYGNDTAYVGEAAVAGATEWVVYYGGWGEPVGSPSTDNLAEARVYDVPADPPPADPYPASTYAEQVWVGDAGGHAYVTGAGGGLLDDGFEPNSVGAPDPNLAFIGADLFGQLANDPLHAYGGTYDMYVYSNVAGDFTLTDANGIELAFGSVTGTTSGFVEGENYVVFEDVSIARPGSVFLYYSGQLNGLQLVNNARVPFAVSSTATDPNDNMIIAGDYTVAYDTNGREDELNYGVGSYFGPDVAGGAVYILHTNDSMEYEIVVDAANQGQYELTVDVDTSYGSLDLALTLDGHPLGTLSDSSSGPATMGPLALNLFEGTHLLQWQSDYSGANIYNLAFAYAGAITLDNCEDVYTFGLELAGDANGDCRVNLDDLVLVVAEWTANYNSFAP